MYSTGDATCEALREHGAAPHQLLRTSSTADELPPDVRARLGDDVILSVIAMGGWQELSEPAGGESGRYGSPRKWWNRNLDAMDLELGCDRLRCDRRGEA